jgi:hypothetical protein
VKSYYNTFQSGDSCSFPWKRFCKVKALLHIAFFIWTALCKILTIENLSRQGLTLVNWCCLCKKSEEIVNHLLIHCEFTSEIWHLVLVLFGVSWAMFGNILELLKCWKMQGQRQFTEAIWKVILVWSIWRERN